MKRISFVFVFLSILFAFFSCEKEKDKTNIYLSQNEIEFDYEENYADFKMSNIGSEDFTWAASTESDFIFFTESSGLCKKNSFVEIGVNLNRSEITGDSISTSINISTDNGDDRTIEVLVLNYPEEKIRLGFQVYDAQYDYKNDQLVMIPNYYPNIVAIFDLSTLQIHQVEIEEDPRHITILPAGGIAVVSYQNGQFGMAATINTVTKKLIDTFSNDNVYYSDIIGAPENLVYFFPNYSNDKLGLLNIITGDFNYLNNGFNIANAKLHPTGKYIYACDYSRLTKLNIENQLPVEEYSTYQYDTDGAVWISKDGDYIFTRSKQILKIEPEMEGIDIVESETLLLDRSYLHYIEQNEVKNEYYIIPSNYSYSPGSQCDQIYIFGQNFNFKSTIDLEDYMYKINNSPGYQTSPPSAEYVFCSSDGNQIIVVTKGTVTYASDSWGIEIINR